MKNLLKISLITIISVMSLTACSGGGDKDEMAPLSDAELLERGKAGHNPTGGPGVAQPPPGTPQGGPERPGGR